MIEGELHHRCKMESILVMPKKKTYHLSLIMPIKLLDFCFNLFQFFVGNLAQNSTLFLSNEPFLLIRSCVYNIPSFLLLFHTKNILSIIVKHETITPRILGYVSPFFQNYAWSHMRIFRNSKFSTKTEIMLMFVQSKWVLEIQVIP